MGYSQAVRHQTLTLTCASSNLASPTKGIIVFTLSLKSISEVVKYDNFFISMAAQRNKDDKQIQKDFDKWKKEAKDKVNKMKKDKPTEDEVYERLLKSK